MKISVSSYSFQQYIRAEKMTQFDTVAKAKELGFDAIEFTNITGETHEEQIENAKKIKAEADRLGMTINAYTIGANLFKEDEKEAKEEIDRLKKELEVAKILGVPLMRHDVCYTLTKTGNGRSFDLMLPTIAKNARELTEYAATLGIKTCSENHGFIAQDSDRVERLYHAVAHDNYGILVEQDLITFTTGGYSLSGSHNFHLYLSYGLHSGYGIIIFPIFCRVFTLKRDFRLDYGKDVIFLSILLC